MILASIKPYYYYLIGEGKKKIEVRKSALKNLPQDIVFYMSKDEKSFAQIPKEFQEKYRKHFGKVGLKIVCDKVEKVPTSFISPETEKVAIGACLNVYRMCNYGKNKPLYGWNISDLRIYDKPKELSEFRKKGFMTEEEWLFNLYPNTHCHYEAWAKKFEITRPPQSWCYVEELCKAQN